MGIRRFFNTIAGVAHVSGIYTNSRSKQNPQILNENKIQIQN